MHHFKENVLFYKIEENESRNYVSSLAHRMTKCYGTEKQNTIQTNRKLLQQHSSQVAIKNINISKILLSIIYLIFYDAIYKLYLCMLYNYICMIQIFQQMKNTQMHIHKQYDELLYMYYMTLHRIQIKYQSPSVRTKSRNFTT